MPCSCGKSFRPIQILSNALNAAGRVAIATVKGKPVFAPEDMAAERLRVCSNGRCPWFRERPALRCTHPDCGCFLKAKVLLTTETCPEGFWERNTLH